MNSQSETVSPQSSSSPGPQPSSTSSPQPSPEKPGRGRPRVLDDFKRAQICGMISAGCSIRDAAHFMRCSYHTIHRDLKRDPAFKEQLRRSELYAQLSPLRAIQQAAATHWQAAAWFLERAYPERFGRRGLASLGPRQARELYDAVHGIIQDEVPDPVRCVRIEQRMRAAFRCFIRATGQNARTCRDLRDVLKSFEKDGLAGLMPRFNYFDPLASFCNQSAQPRSPERGKPSNAKPADRSPASTSTRADDLRAAEKIAQKLRDALTDPKPPQASSNKASAAPPHPSARPTPAPNGKNQ